MTTFTMGRCFGLVDRVEGTGAEYGCRQEEEVLLSAVMRIIHVGLYWSLLLCGELEWIDDSPPSQVKYGWCIPQSSKLGTVKPA